MGTSIKIDNFIYPYFVRSGFRRREEIAGFPGQFRFSIDLLVRDISEIIMLGIDKVLLFGIPDTKDSLGSPAYMRNNIVAQAVKEIKEEFPDLTVMTDICLCAYTNHGHCGIVKSPGPKTVKSQVRIDDNKTLKALSRVALTHAEAGADWVAPSAMAKGQVLVIREALDQNGFKDMKIMGYSAKFSSNFYGPFREAANSAPRFGDRRPYQLDFSDEKAALREIRSDIEEGADVVMVKPALSYLDIIKSAKQSFNHSLAAYNTSGEYSFVKYGSRSGLWDEKRVVLEIISSIKRAGADYIISYHAKDIAQWIRKFQF